MSPRTGRPKSTNPKNERITVRLDSETSQTLNFYCKQEQVEKAEAIRRGISKLKADIKKQSVAPAKVQTLYQTRQIALSEIYYTSDKLSCQVI